jgi:hypothetical protein
MPRAVPRAVPRSESAGNSQKQTDCIYVTDIFRDGEYMFQDKLMGKEAIQEIEEAFFRTIPIYFRGCAKFPDVSQLLDARLPSGRQVRDIIRYLRVYLRFERFQSKKRAATSNHLSIVAPTSLYTDAQLELEMYKVYSARLDALAQLPFQAHKIKLEICVFYGRDDERARYNLFETVKPAYYLVKEAGADVSVQWEGMEKPWDFRLDATELYDQDVTAWANVRSHNLEWFQAPTTDT